MYSVINLHVRTSSYLRWEVACVSAERGWSTSTSESITRCSMDIDDRPFLKGRIHRQGKIWESGLNSQLCCTMVEIELQFSSFPAPQLTCCSPELVHRLRCSVSVLIHIAFKYYKERRILGSQVMGIHVAPGWRQERQRETTDTNRGRSQIFSLAQSWNSPWWLISQPLRMRKLSWAGWLRSPELGLRHQRESAQKTVQKASIPSNNLPSFGHLEMLALSKHWPW